MSYREAAECYGIPRKTIHDYANKLSIGKPIGRPTIFPPSLLVDCIIALSDWGFGLTRRQIQELAEVVRIFDMSVYQCGTRKTTDSNIIARENA